jgi:uncharacterized membrane protein (DUF4010 family)
MVPRDDPLEFVAALATSIGIGLLVGLERERNPQAKAGLRTFALVATLGSLCAVLASAFDSGWIVAAGFLLTGGVVAAAYLVDRATIADASGTTTVVAVLIVFGLGALIVTGERQLAVAVGVATTVLLYFKAELEGFSHKLTAQDLRTMLQFAVLSAVILPLLPNQPFGPFGVLNPFELWLMVVLIAGVSLAGYVAWRLTLDRHGLWLTGLLGGLVSSTATTLVAARQVREGAYSPAAGIVVTLLANMVMLVRVLGIVAVIRPALLPLIATVCVPALLAGAPAVIWRWRAAGTAHNETGEYRNPAGLRTALVFAAIYGAILVLTAWAQQYLGTRGVYGLAFVAGLTDVDAITLSVLRLQSGNAINPATAATAIGLAIAGNFVLKTALVFGAGGAAAGWAALRGFALPLLALAGGIVALQALA